MKGVCLMKKQTYKMVIGGVVALMIAMGIGRFSYTPILPLMQGHLHFSDTVAGLLASSNYAGYLVGAIGTMVFSYTASRERYLQISLLISIGTTCAMGLTDHILLFHLLRFLSGIASAYIFVLASSIVLDYLAKIGKAKWSGILYAGVGLGILFSSFFIPSFYRISSWQGTWIGLAIISVILFFLPLLFIRRQPVIKTANGLSEVPAIAVPEKSWFPFLTIAYGLEGFGYIITGTFIVAMAEQSTSFTGNATTVWMVAGICAIPSCMIWAEMADRFGYMKILTIIFCLQAIGIILPAIHEHAIMFYGSAILFGVTFMGITTITTTVARQMFPVNSSKVLGFLTVIYATGQMVGPAIGGWLADATNCYIATLWGAGLIVSLGGGLIATGMKYDKKGDELNAIR